MKRLVVLTFDFTSWTDLGRNSPVHKNIDAPTTVDHRYITEEVHLWDFYPSLCKVFGIDTKPVYDLIDRCETCVGRTLVTRGKRFTDFGLDGKSKEDIIAILNGTA